MLSVSDRPRRIAQRGPLAAALAFTGVVAVLLIGGCNDNAAPSPSTTELLGDAVPVGQGTARTVVVSNSSGPQSIGVELTPAALDGLPATDAEYSLPLPAGMSAPPWDHVTINWNSQGHPPAMYMLPHFDFHFYIISPSQQAKIAGGPDMVPVPAADVPQDYTSGVQSVPDMGVHWVDTLAAEFHGATFDHTLIYGFSQRSMVFVEPMITRAFLGTQPSVTMSVKQPQAFQQPGRYPRSWSVRTQPSTGAVRVMLDSLTTH